MWTRRILTVRLSALNPIISIIGRSILGNEAPQVSVHALYHSQEENEIRVDDPRVRPPSQLPCP